MSLRSIALAALASVAVARKCKDMMVPVSITARNAVFNLDLPLTAEKVTDFYVNLGTQGANYTAELLEGYADVSGDYKLAATYCEPDDGPGSLLQIMSHGVGFDRSYWDIDYKNYKYSYVAQAVDERGYSTLTWDRLGVGASSKGDPLSEIQMFLEIAALKELTHKARHGKLPSCTRSFDKVVHIGHSFGSAMTYSLARTDPHLTDGIILTGYSQISQYFGLFCLGGNFAPMPEVDRIMGGYPKGYVGAGSSRGNHINFFGPGDFDVGLLKYYNARAKPNTPGEILTVGAGGGEINNFKGPVLMVTGERDIPFCGGDCMATSAIAGASPNLISFSESFFPEASYFNATVIPKAGHGLNMGYSHVLTYETMLDFIDSEL